MPTQTVPLTETGAFVQSLLDGPDDFATQIGIRPDYATGLARVDWTWRGGPVATSAPAAGPARAAAPRPRKMAARSPVTTPKRPSRGTR